MSDDLLSVSTPDSNVIHQDFDRAKNRIDDLNRQILLLRVRVDALQTWQEHAIASQQAERENAIQARQEILALNETNAVLQARCDELQSDKEALEAQAKQENETLRQKILALNETNAVLQARCDELQSDKEALEAQAKQENETLRQKILALNETNAVLQARCDGLQSDKEASESEKESLEAEVQVVQQERDRLREQLEAAEHTNEGLQVRENETLQAIASQQAANRSNEQQIALLRAKVESMNVSLAAERERNETSRQEIAALENANGNLHAEKEALVAQAKQENELLRQKMAELEQANGNLHAEKKALLEQNDALLEQNDKLTIENEGRVLEAIQDRQVIDETLHELGDMEMELDEVQGERDKEVCVSENLRYEIEFRTKVNDREIESKDREIERLKNKIKISTGSSVTPDDPQPTTAVTPAPPPSKRDQSMTATTKSSSAVSTSPTRKRSKMSHETTSNAQPEPPASVMPVDDSDESMMNIDDQVVKFGTATDDSSSLVTTQGSLGGEQATLTQSEATETNSIVLSDRASHTKLSAEEKSKALLIRLDEEFRPFLDEKYGDGEYAWENLITSPAPTMMKNGTIFIRLCFLVSRSYLNKFFGFLTKNTERNVKNGIILRQPLGLRAIVELLGISRLDNFLRLLIENNFTHHPDNPQQMRLGTNLRQDFKLYHPDMYDGANPALVQLRNVPPSHTSLPRRQPDADAFNIKTLVDNLIAEEDKYSKYEVAIRICEQLRNFRDKERILEQLNLLRRDKNIWNTTAIILHVAGVETRAKKIDDANEKLASRLYEGGDFVRQDDVFVSNNTSCMNRGQQVYKDALEANAGVYSRAQQMSTGKHKAMKQVREAVISSVNGRFMYEKNGALQVIPENELSKKIRDSFATRVRVR